MAIELGERKQWQWKMKNGKTDNRNLNRQVKRNGNWQEMKQWHG